MSETYSIVLENGNVLRVKFVGQADNDQIVKDAEARLDEMTENGELAGGSIIKA